MILFLSKNLTAQQKEKIANALFDASAVMPYYADYQKQVTKIMEAEGDIRHRHYIKIEGDELIDTEAKKRDEYLKKMKDAFGEKCISKVFMGRGSIFLGESTLDKPILIDNFIWEDMDALSRINPKEKNAEKVIICALGQVEDEAKGKVSIEIDFSDEDIETQLVKKLKSDSKIEMSIEEALADNEKVKEIGQKKIDYINLDFHASTPDPTEEFPAEEEIEDGGEELAPATGIEAALTETGRSLYEQIADQQVRNAFNNTYVRMMNGSMRSHVSRRAA